LRTSRASVKEGLRITGKVVEREDMRPVSERHTMRSLKSTLKAQKEGNTEAREKKSIERNNGL
jgi:hypothetical protein